MATIAEQLTSLANTKTAIKDAIVAKGVSVADTDPFSAYPAKIGEISGAPATKFGANVDTWIGEVDANGVLQAPTAQTALNFAGITEIGEDALSYAFNENQCITSVDFSSLQSVGTYGMGRAFDSCTSLTSIDLSSLQSIKEGGLSYTFNGCTSITSVDLSSLTTVLRNGLGYAFQGCSGITSIDLSSLQTISEGSLQYTFYGCRGITSVDLSSLQSIAQYGLTYTFYSCSGIISVDLGSLQSLGYGGLSYTFYHCTSLTAILFPSLTSVHTNSFDNAFRNCTALTEIHFRADMQETIEAMSQYADKFGATNATIYFDLIGTITVNGVAYLRSEPDSIYADGVKTFVAWKGESDNIVYTVATIEPAVDTVVYSDAGTTQVGIVEAVA